MDNLSKQVRSKIMASIASVNTKPELQLRYVLHSLGVRYKLHDRTLPGSPDIVFPKYCAVVFVHGCFWHMHGCRLGNIPRTRTQFWIDKFRNNAERDQRNLELLHNLGWRSLIVWECAIKTSAHNLEELGKVVRDWLKSEVQYEEIGI